MNEFRRWWRKVWRITVGTIVVITGVILLPLPGPGTLIIIAGLAIMASEFDPADRLLRELRRRYEKARDAVLDRKPAAAPADTDPSVPDDTEPAPPADRTAG